MDVAILPGYPKPRMACAHSRVVKVRCDLMRKRQKQAEMPERRCGMDRRRQRAPRVSKYWLTGRREALRRKGDRHGLYGPDRHSHKTFFVILLIVSLSVLDAIFTLNLVSHGATELNPIMDYYLRQGPLVFFMTKYLLTFASVMLILLYQNAFLFRTRLRVKSLFFVFALSFAAIVQWELYLMASLNAE